MGSKNPKQLLRELKSMLSKHTYRSQGEICNALEKKGFSANQVMVSRLLHKLGAIKKPNNDGVISYGLPEQSQVMSPNHALINLVSHIAINQTMIVIRTSPGSAQLVGKLLDQLNYDGILGTVAGDDTIFIAPKNTKHIKIVKTHIESYLLDNH